jgi:hypothetical protein
MIGVVYLYTSKSTKKNYVGQTIHEGHRRRQHLYLSKNAQDHFHRAIKKRGMSDFDYTVLFSMETNDSKYLSKKLDEIESYYIKLYDSDNKDYGYNIKPGGKTCRGYTLSDLTKRKLSKAHIGIPMSSSAKAKLSFPVLQYSPQGAFIKEFPSMMEAWRSTGVSWANISKCCQGKRKSAGGFCWKLKISKNDNKGTN